MKKRIKKLLVSFLLFLMIFGQVGRVPEQRVRAQSAPVLSDFAGRQGCDPSNPSSCQCLFIFRDKQNGTIVNSVVGTTSNKNTDLTMTMMTFFDASRFDVAVFALKGNHNNDNCYFQQEKSVDDFKLTSWAVQQIEGCAAFGAAGAAAGAAVGTVAAPVTGAVGASVGCAIGSFAVAQDQTRSIFENWDGDGNTQTRPYACNWRGESGSEYTISNWFGITSWNRNKVGRFNFVGHDGLSVLPDRFARDDFICGFLIGNVDFARDGETATASYDICTTNLAVGSDAYNNCVQCFGNKDGTGQGGIWTAVGCIDKNPKAMIGKIINLSLGIAGGIALLMILASAFALTVSGGDVKKTSEAKERLTAAIIGLIFIIFSVTILQFIGEGVLKIPGFGGG